MKKRCAWCGQVKPTTEYPFQRKGGAFSVACSECYEKTYSKNHTKKNPIRICLVCGNEHKASNSGIGRSLSCRGCYTLYRKALTLLKCAEYRAIKRGKKINLDVPWILARLNKPCPYTGLPMVVPDGHQSRNYKMRHPSTPTIDRIDSSGSYTKDNSEVVSWWANLAKSFYSKEVFLNLCKAVCNNHENKPIQPQTFFE